MPETTVHDHPAIEDRHDHERQIYDAMAAEILAGTPADQLAVRADRIPFPNREHVDYLSAAIDLIGPLPGARILEVGVGGGSLAAWLALQGATVTGIDVSAGILEVARRRAGASGVADRLRLVHTPVEEFDDPDSSFDAIIGNNVVHHFERGPALANLARMLQPDGRAAFCEPVMFAGDMLRRLRYSGPVSRRFPPHTHTPDERSLDRLDLQVIERYFGHVGWQPFQVTCRLQNFVELSDRAWNRLEGLDRLLLRRVPATRWLARMIVLDLRRPVKPKASRGTVTPPERRDQR